MRGGHRLWVAPEVPEITYEPDDDPIRVERGPQELTLNQPPTDAGGIEKTVRVALRDGRAHVDHVITNHRHGTVDIAPWAITQLVPGGTGILPLPQDPIDPHGLQPNGSIVVWPYAGVADSPFTLRNRLLLLDGNRKSPTKVGAPLSRGWAAYASDGMVFVKRASHNPNGRYLDNGASAQCYCNAMFLELETLGEQVKLVPGESTSHTETWELYRVDPAMPVHEIPAELDLDGGT